LAIELPRPTIYEVAKSKSLSMFRSTFIMPAKRNSVEVQAAIEENELKLQKLIQVNLKLPENVFWWEAPVVGCWEEGMPDVPVIADVVRKSHHCGVVPDFIVSDIPERVELDKLVPEQIMPRIPEGYKFHSELTADFENSKKLRKQQAKLNREGVKNSKSKITDTVHFKTPPRDLFPAPVRIPRLEITDRIMEIPVPAGRKSIDEDDDEPFPSEPDTTLAEFVKTLVPLRAKEQPYFRNYSQIALFEEDEDGKPTLTLNVPTATVRELSPTVSAGTSDEKLEIPGNHFCCIGNPSNSNFKNFIFHFRRNAPKKQMVEAKRALSILRCKLQNFEFLLELVLHLCVNH
jgi:hypothetical protein